MSNVHMARAQVEAYSYYGTGLDNKIHLDYNTGHKTPETTIAAATLAGRMALRLVHDHKLPLEPTRNLKPISEPVGLLVRRIANLTMVTHERTQGPHTHTHTHTQLDCSRM